MKAKFFFIFLVIALNTAAYCMEQKRVAPVKPPKPPKKQPLTLASSAFNAYLHGLMDGRVPVESFFKQIDQSQIPLNIVFPVIYSYLLDYSLPLEEKQLFAHHLKKIGQKKVKETKEKLFAKIKRKRQLQEKYDTWVKKEWQQVVSIADFLLEIMREYQQELKEDPSFLSHSVNSFLPHNTFHQLDYDSVLLDLLEPYIKKGLSSNVSLLWLAIHNKNMAVVDFLLFRGAKLNRGDINMSPGAVLLEAVQKNQIKVLQALANFKVDPKRLIRGRSVFHNPFFICGMHNNIECARILLKIKDNGLINYVYRAQDVEPHIQQLQKQQVLTRSTRERRKNSQIIELLSDYLARDCTLLDYLIKEQALSKKQKKAKLGMYIEFLQENGAKTYKKLIEE